ncbi:unnamed protein product [Mytilus coruscus]|uniref:AMP-dependent synthetase/ligase domain-containing protein n=1 Tax=Mytilus coruscus TaxID=42192 RepID=A0A6J8BG40_MYTCO|nr:unnamed protein product [Mytilus coruscus]
MNQSDKCTAIIFGDSAEKIDIIRHFVSGTDDNGIVLKTDVSSLKYAIRVGTEDNFSDDEVKCSSFPLKCVASAGFPLSKTYANVVGKVARRFINVYGTTELGSVCYKEIERPEDFEDYNSVGFPVGGIEITVIDQDGKLCQRNFMGGINVRSSVRLLGYLNNQEKTIEVLDKSGWFKTNDTGYVTSDGQVIKIRIQLGIQPGDVVGLGLPNIPEWILCHFGIALAGAITLGFPYFSNDGRNIVKALNQSDRVTNAPLLYSEIVLKRLT